MRIDLILISIGLVYCIYQSYWLVKDLMKSQ